MTTKNNEELKKCREIEQLFYKGQYNKFYELKKCDTILGYNPLNMQRYSDKRTIMHDICGKVPIKRRKVKQLLENGADPNIQDYEGDTPLHMATWLCKHAPIWWRRYGACSTAKLLLKYGADPTIKNKWGYTPAENVVTKRQMMWLPPI